MLLYAQDTLIGALSLENWAHMAIFAEQVQCPVLSEAALMMGVRSLVPPLLATFRVTTGLERVDDDKAAEKEQQADGVTEQSATVGTAMGRPAGGAAFGTVDLELEGHLMGLRAGVPGAEPAAILALKKGCPAQYAELKIRLADSITSAQRTGAQLQRCVQFFDSHERRGFRRDDKHGRALLIELAVLALCLAFFVIPSSARQAVLTYAAAALEPFRASFAFMGLGLPAPFSSAVFRVAASNVFMFLVLCGVIWHNLNK
uniref:Uncharacterized protein n=1 Tax=Alexandrium catenella TaxID=2925 RepID=A0A7S1S968_ALECA